MNTKKILLLAMIACGIGNVGAVTLTLTGIANTTVGQITEGVSDTLASGNARFYSTTTDLAPGDLTGILSAANPVTFFEGLITTGTSSSPGLIRGPVAYASGNLLSTGTAEFGDVNNFTYLFLGNADNSFIGVYQGANVPAGGAVTFNPNTITEDLIGTSAPQIIGTTNSGFQLVPEPSTFLLGLFGMLGFLRRKR